MFKVVVWAHPGYVEDDGDVGEEDAEAGDPDEDQEHEVTLTALGQHSRLVEWTPFS